MRRLASLSVACCLLFLCSAAAFADLTARRVDLYSEGVRLSGTLYYDAALDGQKLPAVILSHGWGGTASMLRPEAERFARAGYLALAFDYRGWGASDGRWVRDGAAGAESRRELREVVDPIDQATDVINAVHWIMGEPMADATRVGLWGTSFSGGLVAYVAARDPRIKATVSQVAAFGWPRDRMPPEMLNRAEADATRRARGEIGYPSPGTREVGNLYGAPIRESFLRYAPIDDIPAIRGCAMLIIDAEKEELFDLREHGALAFERAAEPKKRVVIPGITHYGIYSAARDQAIGLAVEWMDRHLKRRP
ncbi:MAG: CocE/NonD family hydrolase [Burkholderiales bacterium]